jgi:hypothetical protein
VLCKPYDYLARSLKNSIVDFMYACATFNGQNVILDHNGQIHFCVEFCTIATDLFLLLLFSLSYI